MNKLGFLCGTAELSTPPFSDSISLNLKLSAEKLVKEQASVIADLDMATTKLKKSMDDIHSLEEKLQNAINENAKLKVKQKEDSKLWEGSSTNTSSDQLAERLQYLACRVRDAEHDKNQLEDKLSESSKAFDCLDLQMKDLAVKLESAEDNIKKSKAELIELKVQKEEMEKRHTDESSRAVSLIGEKDALIKDLEGTVAADKLCFQSLNSRLEEVQHELSLKEDICKCLTAIQNNLEKEKSALQLSNDDFARRLLASGEEIKGLETLVHELVEKLIELDKHGAMVSDNIVQLNHAFDTCYKLVQQEKNLTANRTQIQIARLDNQLLHVRSEKEAFQSGNEDLKNKVIELQSSHESFMAQHAEESRLAEVKVQKIESEAEVLVSKKTELELLVSKLGEKIELLSEASKLSENNMQELSQEHMKLRRSIRRRNSKDRKALVCHYFLWIISVILTLYGFDGQTFYTSILPILTLSGFEGPPTIYTPGGSCPSFVNMLVIGKQARSPLPPSKENNGGGQNDDRFSLQHVLRFRSKYPEFKYLVCSLQIKTSYLLRTERGRALLSGIIRDGDCSLHGLWPPDSWRKLANLLDTSVILSDSSLLSELMKRWPSLEYYESRELAGHLNFWAYEWETHGHLSGLTPTQYFELAIYLHKVICPPLEEALQFSKGRPISSVHIHGVEGLTIKSSLFDSAIIAKVKVISKVIWTEFEDKSLLTEVRFNVCLAEIVQMEIRGKDPPNDELVVYAGHSI